VEGVRAHGLAKTFGEGRAARRVLDDAHLEVAPAEVVAVLGRSGSGESTLLHLLGGLDRLDAGVIEVGGEPVTGAPRAPATCRRRAGRSRKPGRRLRPLSARRRG